MKMQEEHKTELRADELMILKLYRQLNDRGKANALEKISDLTELRKYLKKDDHIIDAHIINEAENVIYVSFQSD